MSTLNIAVIGLGTVGTSVVQLLQDQVELLQQRCGKRLQVWAVSARDKAKDRGLNLKGVAWEQDPVKLVQQDDIDLVVELIGGVDQAKEIISAALTAGKPVVTANKALIAAHGAKLAKLAEQHGVALAFEAAVAGGIPALKTLREGLSGNEIQQVRGILNGTCNYILTTMQKTGAGFDETLLDAQKLGYAEADPTFDVDGIDTAHKLAILTAIAFGVTPAMDMPIDGIRSVSIKDVRYADRLGYAIKLLGITRKNGTKIMQAVYPALVPKTSAIAGTNSVTNAVEYQGNAVGELLLQGPGAGGHATASAVLADICDVAGGRLDQPFGIPTALLQEANYSDLQDRVGQYYLRLNVSDTTGVAGQITTTLAEHDISIERLEQLPDAGNSVILILTHDCKELDIQAALNTLGNADFVTGEPVMLRVEG